MMSEAARILLELLSLGRSPGALRARAELAEDRAIHLRKKSARVRKQNPRRADRILARALWWAERCRTLRERQ